MTPNGFAAAIFYLLTTDYWAVARSQARGTCWEYRSIEVVLHNVLFLWMDLDFQHISDPECTFSNHMGACRRGSGSDQTSVQSPSGLSWGSILCVMVSLGWGFHLGLADSRSLLRQKDITSLWGRLPSRPVTFTLLSTGHKAHSIQVQTAVRQRGKEEGKKRERKGER